MPDRILRSAILDSDKVNSLSWAAEVFYRRLMSVVDDYGRIDARPSFLRAALYPVKLDKVANPDIAKWTSECAAAGLVRVYHIHDKPYMEVINFRQRLRAMRSKYPPPPESADIRGHLTADDSRCPQMTADDGQKGREEKRRESETETETKAAGSGPPSAVVFPFEGEAFKKQWIRWKDYRKKEHGFRFKSHDSEQASLNHLKNLAGDNEQTAVAIIQQSLQHTWKGFFELKARNGNQVNGQFPNHFSREFERKLPPESLSEYWAHLRGLGLKPVRDARSGEAVDWK